VRCLQVRSYELGVLLLPSLEEAYRRHPHRGFSCTAGPAAAQPRAAAAEGPVEFWSLASREQQAPEGGSGGEAAAAAAASRMHLPLPYQLPPVRYAPGDQPWMVDRPEADLDALGLPWGRGVKMYGWTEPAAD
jgi:tyrosyl-DNA phosphodiesterase-1